MNKPRLLTGKILQLDNNVWLVMLGTLLVSFLLLGFRHLSRQECTSLSIAVDGQIENGVAVKAINRLLIFSLKKVGPAKITWSFDDGTGKQTGSSVSHKFTKEGAFKVVAKVEGGCRYEQVVSIRMPANRDKQPKTEILILEDPINIKPGTWANFFGITNLNARQYQWTIKGHSDSAKYGPAVSFFFPHAGESYVQLTLDNDPKKPRTRKISVVSDVQSMGPLIDPTDPGNFPTVTPGGGPGSFGGNADNPFERERDNQDKTDESKTGGDQGQDEKEPKKKVDAVTFQGLLEQVIGGNKEVSELYQYLDYGESTKVQETGKSILVNIGPFCREMMRRPNAKIGAVELVLDDKSSVQIIKVQVEETKRRRGIFGNLFGGKD